ncbi:plastocyanin/azurin family domain protein [Sphingomonas sp. Leaf357]|uniref:methylamine utilization protein n=1 Tax=Sphingomonas sp. Leaf357 TaxID=1736350 RepID=UPI0006FD2213|nr:methylamine utilization protein [Sphingomonas sp. Leaf357]KQS04969.1 plastocyanin/azurin family domain protein [Sphingomonas sp. Leaf357]
MLFRAYLALLATAVTPVAAHAATANIDVRGADGKPLVGAVVMIDTPKKPAAPIRFDWGTAMAQRNIQFDPHVLIVPIGSTVTFPNFDKVRHHVYSFSKAKKFDLKLYGKDDTRSVVFDHTGAVALGCNIHDQMSAFIIVVDTPFAVQTDAAGHATISNLPAGGATVRVWHPSIRAADNMLAQAATIGAGGFTNTYTITGK